MNHKFLLLIAAIATLQTESSVAKSKKNLPTKILPSQNLLQSIDYTYFLQIPLTENDCEKALGSSCLFRDSLFQEPYLHPTTLTIFLGKIFAKQHFHDKTILLKVEDAAYSLKTDQQNMVSFTTKNGEAFNLKLTQGNLTQERQEQSRCAASELLYNFYYTYDQQDQLVVKFGQYKDEYNFDGINEYTLFTKNDEPAEIMAVTKKPTSSIVTSINNLQLCRPLDGEVLNTRHINSDDCTAANPSEECTKYATCEDVVAIENCEVTLFKDGF